MYDSPSKEILTMETMMQQTKQVLLKKIEFEFWDL